MASSRTWNGVTQSIFDCVKTTSAEQHGTVYAPPDADEGTATTDTPVGQVVVGFKLDTSAATLTYTIQKKPFLVSDSQIFNGIDDTVNGCRSAT